MHSILLELMGISIVLLMFIQPIVNTEKYSVDSRQYISFHKVLTCVLINLLSEMAASYVMSKGTEYSLLTRIVVSEVYFNSIILVLVVFAIYGIHMLNEDLPSLKRIGNWIYFVIGLCAVVLDVIPLLSLRIEGETITFKPMVFIDYAIILLVELLVIVACFVYRNYINKKRIQITGIGFALHVVTMLTQLFHPHVFFISIGVVIIVFSYYMTIENEDVKLLKQLEDETILADEANKSKSNFIANVSHQIRTPINAVLGLDEMILRESHEEATRQYATDIKAAAQTLHSLINEILDMSKMELGKMEILNVNYNMRSLINDTINIIQMKMDNKALKFVVDVDKNIPAGYNGDDVRIKQVLLNILTNAVKYTNEGAVTMTITGEKLLDGKELLHFTIEDTGIGMTGESLDALFDEFKRFDNDKNRNVEGTGLGMTITMKLIKLMGSELKVSSTYGKGSVFSFDLEQTIWDETALGDFRMQEYKTAPKYEKSFVAPETKVLIVDDNAINRKVFIGLLKDTKLVIEEAESGPECINMVKKNKYNLIFMDHMMPDMDGIETFHKLREMDDNLSIDAKVIMLTANAVNGARETYIEEGFDDFMAKPIIPDKLEEMIKKYL